MGQARPNSKERQESIDYFYQYHGNHSRPVEIEIDVTAMVLLWRRHYKGRVDIKKYLPNFGETKLPLKIKKAP